MPKPSFHRNYQIEWQPDGLRIGQGKDALFVPQAEVERHR
jgi:hypothetical protein